MTITAPEMFQEMAANAPLPWREHKFKHGVIVDAKGEVVCWFDGNDPSWRNIASMIIVAVNTCGGFKAEIAYDPTTQPFDEPLRHQPDNGVIVPHPRNPKPDTFIICVPNDKHEGPCDMSGWVDIVEPTTGRVTGGSAVCTKCGMMALNNSIWD